MPDFPEYRIETVLDFQKLPPERVDDALREFREFLRFAETVKPLVDSGLLEPVGAFLWVDDDKNEGRVDFVDRDSGKTVASFTLDLSQ